ncbi:hypothetical protein NDU88_005099 [Pleurodeles waltl]|uniref:Uncharacterized protein n=1 Tax=Pleurodeles waltl TaxID=8319 RepID=A0AAV7MY94_PLEWA|nr:hypothetical protein NDU88_005099 [Pleurodeles waltl]
MFSPCLDACRMSLERRPGKAEESGAANWFRAALELRRRRRVASRVPLRGKPGRGSTSCSAGTNMETASQKIFGAQELARGTRKPVLETGTLAQIPPLVRNALPITAGFTGV